MNIKVRFTAPEDLDLIALVHSGVRMGLVIRDVLRAYVRQEIFYVPMPNTIKCINTENTFFIIFCHFIVTPHLHKIQHRGEFFFETCLRLSIFTCAKIQHT